MSLARTLADWAYKAATEHEAVLGLVALAFIIAMPPDLPGPFNRCEPLSWAWGWLFGGLKTLISLQHPTTQTKITETHSVAVETPTPIQHEPAEIPQKEVNEL